MKGMHSLYFIAFIAQQTRAPSPPLYLFTLIALYKSQLYVVRTYSLMLY